MPRRDIYHGPIAIKVYADSVGDRIYEDFCRLLSQRDFSAILPDRDSPVFSSIIDAVALAISRAVFSCSNSNNK